MTREIDVRGLSCPQPVLLTKKAIDAGESEIIVIANDKVARDNIKALAVNLDYKVEISEKERDMTLKITKRSDLNPALTGKRCNLKK
jgi:TusA-related sulfurtransferase